MIKERIDKLLQRVIDQAEELLSDEDYVEDGLDLLLKASAIYKNLAVVPETPPPIDIDYQEATNEDLRALARRSTQGNP
jgi:hypothetical protein